MGVKGRVFPPVVEETLVKEGFDTLDALLDTKASELETLKPGHNHLVTVWAAVTQLPPVLWQGGIGPEATAAPARPLTELLGQLKVSGESPPVQHGNRATTTYCQFHLISNPSQKRGGRGVTIKRSSKPKLGKVSPSLWIVMNSCIMAALLASCGPGLQHQSIHHIHQVHRNDQRIGQPIHLAECTELWWWMLATTGSQQVCLGDRRTSSGIMCCSQTHQSASSLVTVSIVAAATGDSVWLDLKGIACNSTEVPAPSVPIACLGMCVPLMPRNTWPTTIWFGGLNVKGKNVLNNVVNVCGKVVGERQEHLSQLYERHVVWKARVMVDDNSHAMLSQS